MLSSFVHLQTTFGQASHDARKPCPLSLVTTSVLIQLHLSNRVGSSLQCCDARAFRVAPGASKYSTCLVDIRRRHTATRACTFNIILPHFKLGHSSGEDLVEMCEGEVYDGWYEHPLDIEHELCQICLTFRRLLCTYLFYVL